MAGKKKDIALQTIISNQEQWEEALATKGLLVVDVYQAWCGPCKTTVSFFRKIKNELGDDLLQFAVADADNIDALEKYRGKCEPTFLFLAGGELVAVVRGANPPLLQKTIIVQLEAEKKVLNQGLERKVIKDEAILEKEDETSPIPPQAEGDELFPSGKSYTVAIIKPDAVAHGKADEIIMKIQEAGFELLAHEEKTMTESEARDFYQHRAGEEKFQELIQFMSSGPCHVLIISKSGEEDVIPAWREFIGPTDVEIAKKENPESLRAQYGTEILYNAVHGSDDSEQASRELAFFFPTFKQHQQTEAVSKTPERTLALIRPDVLKDRKDKVLQSIREAGFKIAMQKEIMLSEQQVEEFYKEHVNEDYYPALVQQMTSGPVLALALVMDDAVKQWRSLLGPAKVTEAVNEAPDSLRARFTPSEGDINQLHGSSSTMDAEKEINFFFPVEHTLAAIKPDAMEEHRDEIMERIQASGFTISQIKETNLNQEMAEEFYKEHKGKPFFEQLVDCMCRGPCLMIILSKENAVQEWRALMGPTDPAIAKTSAPDSLRSLFAKGILENAVHGSSNIKHAKEKIQFIFGDIDLDGSSNQNIIGSNTETTTKNTNEDIKHEESTAPSGPNTETTTKNTNKDIKHEESTAPPGSNTETTTKNTNKDIKHEESTAPSGSNNETTTKNTNEDIKHEENTALSGSNTETTTKNTNEDIKHEESAALSGSNTETTTKNIDEDIKHEESTALSGSITETTTKNIDEDIKHEESAALSESITDTTTKNIDEDIKHEESAALSGSDTETTSKISDEDIKHEESAALSENEE